MCKEYLKNTTNYHDLGKTNTPRRMLKQQHGRKYNVGRKFTISWPRKYRMAKTNTRDVNLRYHDCEKIQVNRFQGTYLVAKWILQATNPSYKISGIREIYAISHLPWGLAPSRAQGSLPRAGSRAFCRTQFVFRRSVSVLDRPRKTSQ